MVKPKRHQPGRSGQAQRAPTRCEDDDDVDDDDDIEHRMFALNVWLVPLSKYHLLIFWPDHLVGAAPL